MNNNAPNALLNETSPYLLQHAYNPVRWYPWGEEALSLAKEKDRPILVSIGYSACHWCHVMERESFEDQETADFMNSHFINIKIDREERPDLDHIYMDAVQAITGSGGWPLNVFLTPETKPFYGGTYFPPQKAFNRPSWLDVLFTMKDYWQNKRPELEEQANGLMEHLESSNNLAFKSNVSLSVDEGFYTEEKCRVIADHIMSNADKTAGGFGKAPKFLQTASIRYLLQYAHLWRREDFAAQALLSLSKMVQGGIYDQLGGGISRYSTDNDWLVPHFEKMLYDNALLVLALCDAWQSSRESIYADAIVSTLQFVTNELAHPEGGYYTALDADSEGVEGKFYVWDKSEIESALAGDAQLFCEYYGVSEAGNWEENNILHVKESPESFASSHSLDESEFKVMLKDSRQKLLVERRRRVRPGLDDKILLNCNALLLGAFCQAYAALQDESYLLSAISLASFLEKKFPDNNGYLLHTYKAGEARFPAFLDDYAYYIQGLIQLQEITGDEEYLHTARRYADQVMEQFSDDEGILFYYTRQSQDDVIIRKKEVYDGATPSGNAVMAGNLFYLALVFDLPDWKKRAERMLAFMYIAMEKYPGSFACWAGIYNQQAAGIFEIAVTGKQTNELLKEILQEFIPNKVLQSTANTDPAHLPLLKNKPVEDRSQVYLCRNYACLAPVFTMSEVREMIKKK